MARNKPRTYVGKIAQAREDIANPDLRRLPTLSAWPFLRFLVELARRITPSRISEPSGSGGRPTPGIAEHAEQTDAEKHQTGWLGDDVDGEDAGGTVPAEGSGWERWDEEAAAAARHVDATDVAGKLTRPNFDEHPATTTTTTTTEESAPTASLSAQRPELESVTESPWRKIAPPLPPPLGPLPLPLPPFARMLPPTEIPPIAPISIAPPPPPPGGRPALLE